MQIRNATCSSTSLKICFKPAHRAIAIKSSFNITMLPAIATARFATLTEMFSLGDPTTLRSEMKATNCIISGSAALYMFHPDAFTPNDVDFYVPPANASTFERVLRTRGFDSVQDEGSDNQYSTAGVSAVLRLRKEGTPRTINLITTSNDNPLATVVRFHSTLVMNAITGTGVLSLYPLLTLAGRGIMLVYTDKSLSCFIKYVRRGFRFQSLLTGDNSSHALLPNSLRTIDDVHVLHIPFEYGPEDAVTAADGLTPFYWVLGQPTD